MTPISNIIDIAIFVIYGVIPYCYFTEKLKVKLILFVVCIELALYNPLYFI